MISQNTKDECIKALTQQWLRALRCGEDAWANQIRTHLFRIARIEPRESNHNILVDWLESNGYK